MGAGFFILLKEGSLVGLNTLTAWVLRSTCRGVTGKGGGYDLKFPGGDPEIWECDPKIANLKKRDPKNPGGDPEISECDPKISGRDPNSRQPTHPCSLISHPKPIFPTPAKSATLL